MILSKENLSKIPKNSSVNIPVEALFELPEKVLQFGTGVLLRGLPNHFIDEANRNGVFNGRVVIVKSTDKGGTEEFTRQDNLFTLCVRGISEGKQIDEKIINSSISRVLSASTEWTKILELAKSKDLQVVISNTTETGIKLVNEDVLALSPPSSFPGKLLAFLYERYRAFEGSYTSGLVILPTELIPDNGKLLKNICMQLAAINQFDEDFMYWLINSNDFCNTLVDRIVPGSLPKDEHQEVTKLLGYEDDLMIMSEPYSLWAIETNSDRTKEILSFAKTDPGVVIADSINKHRELKIRLLNAPHTFSCALAIWCGFSTVKQAMENKTFRDYISELMVNEIIPTLVSSEINEKEATQFATRILDRFANPFIAHEWINISFQYTSKVITRCLPVLLKHYKTSSKAPRCISLGLAAYILFMQSVKNEDGNYVGEIDGKEYILKDDKANVLYNHWQKKDHVKVIRSVLSDKSLWNQDLSLLPELEMAVQSAMEQLTTKGYKRLFNNELVSI